MCMWVTNNIQFSMSWVAFFGCEIICSFEIVGRFVAIVVVGDVFVVVTLVSFLV